MGCCGSRRQQVAQKLYGMQGTAPAARARSASEPGEAVGSPAMYAAHAGVAFVYDGLAELVVTGSVTGRRYRFAARGARLMVDALDAPALRKVPRLRSVG